MAGYSKGKTIKAHEYRIEDELTGRPDGRYAAGYELTDKEAALAEKVRMFWDEARITQSTSRYEMSMDEDFYDGLQWSDADMMVLKERGQAPLVINEIKPTIDWILGTEKRTRIDHKVLPRKNEEEHGISAGAKTQLIKYIRDVSYASQENSQAFKDQAVAGIGWVEIGVRDSDSEEPIFIKNEDWRNIWYDYRTRSKSLKDCRYVIRAKWVDLDIAIAMFPEKEDSLRAASVVAMSREDDSGEFLRSNTDTTVGGNTIVRTPIFSDDWNVIDNKREVVRIVECWYKEPEKTFIVRGGYYDGVFKDNADEDLLDYEIEAGDATITENISMRVKFAIFTGNIILNSGVSPYNHNKYPFVPVFAYRRKRDGSPYGIVRNLRGVQEDLNKRRSKALHVLSTNRVIASADAASPTGWDEIEAELARPDGIIKLDGRKDARFEADTDKALAVEHINLMEQDKAAIRSIGGVTDENLGQDTNAVSGKAVLAKQNQGSVTTAEIFDNFRFSLQIQGEILLSLIEQFYTEEKSIRIAGAKGRFTHTTINRQTETGVKNDITAAKSDFVISQQDYRESMRQSMADQLIEMIKQLDPEMALNLMDLVVDMTDIPDKEDIVERIRKMNGQSAPADAGSVDVEDKTPPTEEELQEEQRKQAEAQREQQLQQLEMAQKQAEVSDIQADAMLKQAKAGTEQAKTIEAKARSERTQSETGTKKQAHSVSMAQQLGIIKSPKNEKKES